MKISILVLMTLIVLPGFTERAYAVLPGQLPVIRIQAEGLTPLQVGLETGRQVKRQFPDIEQRYDAWLATLFTRSQAELILRQQLPALVKQMDEAWRAELQGVSGAWSLSATTKPGDGQLSLDEYYLLNLLPDLGLLPNGIGFGVYGKAAADNNPVIGRNLDWADNGQLSSLQVITVYEHERQSFVTIGFAGMVSILSGFNDRGLFISLFNAEPHSPYRNHTRFSHSVPSNSFEWRKVLALHSSASTAARYLADKKYNFSYSALLADKKTVQVLEYSPQKNQGRIRQWNSPLNPGRTWEHQQQIALVNCLMLAKMPDTCGAARDAVRWSRLNKLAAASGPQQPADAQTVSRILFDRANQRYELFNTNTLQSFYYLPASNSLYLYSQASNGGHTDAILHQPYLDLLTPEKDWKLPLIWLVWALLLFKSLTVLWVSWKYKKRTQRAGEAQLKAADKKC